jgi:hypothetical protein
MHAENNTLLWGNTGVGDSFKTKLYIEEGEGGYSVV